MNSKTMAMTAANGVAVATLCITTAWTAPTERPTREAEQMSFDQKYIEVLEWDAIGPPRGGRATACTGVVGDPMTYYMGATGGGVWKTTNAGHTWQPLGDDTFTTGSVGAIAVAETDPNVIYVGMGERCPRGNFSHGDGMYKSYDAGKTWEHIGLVDSHQIGKVLVHPRDENLVYVAALGHMHGANDERGVYRSTNGGDDWERILYVDDETGAVELAMNPANPREIYAGFWQVKRTPYSLESGGEGSGIFKTTDGGDTWEPLTKGLPKGIVGKIGLTVSPANPDRVWASVEAEKGGIFRSDNAGESWRRVNEDRSLRQRAWYYSHIYADPENENRVYALNVGFHRSDDGGKTFDTRIRVPHGDNHDLWINPSDPLNMVQANDGGANVSFDGGQSWTQQTMQPTAQFYHVTVDNQFPYRVYGAQQDNSTISVSSRANQFRMGNDWYSVGGGESGYIAVHPENPDIVYAGSYGGTLSRYDHSTRTSRSIMVWPENPMGWGAEHLRYRFQWTFPIFFSPHDSGTVYAAGNVLFKTTNEGQTWTPISPDLTRDDKSKQGQSGGDITGDNTSVEYYCTIFSAAESTHEAGTIWTGSDDGLVHITRDGGTNWTNVTPLDMPEWGMVSQIDLSPHDAGTAYLAVNRYKMDDFTPYIFKTDNYGETWSRIDTGIDRSAFVRAVREDTVRPGLLYAGTETGMWVSFDDGANWQSLQNNLPVVPITDLVVKDDDVVVATQGRSFWILRDVSLLRQMTPSTVDAPMHLFAPAVTYNGFGDSVDVYYTLADDLEGEVTLEFLEPDGDVIKSYKAEKKTGDAEDGDDDDDSQGGGGFFFGGGGSSTLDVEGGVNSFGWNMRYEDAEEVKGAVMWGGSTRGPQAAPGRYQVRMTAGDHVQTQPFEIRPDPRHAASMNDYREQFDLLIGIRDRLSETHEAINTIRAVRAQINDVTGRAKEIGGMENVIEAGDDITTKLGDIEEELIQTRSKSSQDPLNFPIKLNNKIAALAGQVARSNGRPTDASFDVFNDLVERLQPHLEKLGVVMDEDVPAFNRLVSEYQMPAVYIAEDDDDDAGDDG